MIVPRSALHGAAAAAIVAALAAAPGAQADRRPMTIEDLLVAVRIADPQLSPDSRTVAFVRTTTDPASGGATPISGASRRRRRGEGTDRRRQVRRTPRAGARTAAGSRSSRRAMARRRSIWRRPAAVASQDYRPRDGRAAAADLFARWREAGLRVGCLSRVPTRRATSAEGRDREEPGEDAPAHAVFTATGMSGGEPRHHVMVADLESKRVVDVTPGDFDSPPGQQEDAAIAFSPDGREIAFVSNREGNDRRRAPTTTCGPCR